MLKIMETPESSIKRITKSNLIKRVFSKTSSIENSMTEENNSEFNLSKDNEIISLKEQVNSLQQSLFSMQEILEMKEKAITNISKEKEKLLSDVKKHKRSNLNLKQQLVDEREYHMKEKEYFCREMTESYKYRPRKGIIRNDEYAALCTDEQKNEIQNLKTDVTKLKSTLYDTLEANYNLSIKYLRMKNTKYSIKARFKRAQTEQEKVIFDLKQKLDGARDEINYIISEKFCTALPPSNKKYLQIVKHNAQLAHENLSLQVDISKLYNEIERIKAEKLRYETNSKLKYLKKSSIDIKTKCDKVSQTNFAEKQDQEKACRALIFKEKDIEFSEKSSDIFSEVSSLSLNRNYELNKIQSAPEILLD